VLRSPVLAAVATLAVAGCGSPASAPPPDEPVRLGEVPARTTAADTARFTLAITGTFGGSLVTTHETGALSFTRRLAHLYKLVPGNPFPQEQIVAGPMTYSNGNVQAALSDPNVRPWTKLDTRRLAPSQRRLEELDHVRTLAYLPGGASGATRVDGGSASGLAHYRGRVQPAAVLARVPPAQRKAVRAVLRADYAAGPFPADFWVDDRSRLRRVRVSYPTPRGGRITIVGTFAGFGAPVDVKPPAPDDLEDITPTT
jgi:hypothetical protein